MKQKVICLALSLVLFVGLLAGCGKTEKEKINADGYPVVDDEDILYQYADKDYKIIGDVVRIGDGDENEILEDYETVTLSIPASVSEEEYENLFGAYFDGDSTYLFVPDPELLAQGKVQFETLHHSHYGTVLATDEAKIEKYVDRAAALGVTRGITENDLKDSFRETLDHTLESLGIDADTYGGEAFRYIMAKDVKGEILNAALDGDNKTLVNKTTGAIADFLIDLGDDGFGAGDFYDLITTARESEDPAEAALNVVREVEKKLIPEIDAVEKAARLTDRFFDLWADNAINEIYEKDFIGLSDRNGSIKDEDWDAIFEKMRGAETRLKSKGVDEAALRKRFEQRKANETLIEQRKAELNERIDSWKERELLHWNHNGYKRDIDLATRLNSLFSAREMLRQRYTVDGKLNKGELTLTDDEFLDTALEWWADTSKRHEFYQWEKEHGLVREKKTAGNYAWVLVDTAFCAKGSPDEEIWPNITSGSAGSHNLVSKFIDHNGGRSTQAGFAATCQTPPATIRAGDTVSLEVRVECTSVGEMAFSGDAYVRLDPSGLVEEGTYGGPKFESSDGRANFKAVSEAGKTFDGAVVSMTFSSGTEGAAQSIYFEALQSKTEWKYEWRPVEN